MIDKLVNTEVYDPLNLDRPLKVLILEDSNLDVELIRAKLKKEFDFQDEVVYDKAAFAESLVNFIPDIILSDYSMPQFNGLEALELLKQSGIQCPFIIITGAIDEETAVSCIKAGADDYLLKDRLTRLPAAMRQSIQQQKVAFEKEYTRKALEESIRNFLSLGKASPDYVLLISSEGLIKYANREELFNHEISVGKNIFDFLEASLEKLIKNSISEAYLEGKNKAFTIEIGNNEGKFNFYRCRISRVYKNDNYAEYMLLLSDVTDIEESKIDLKYTHNRLRDLLNKLELVRDDEKKRISMEIHDQLGQELTANKLGLFYLKQQLSKGDNLEDIVEDIKRKVEELISLSGNTIKTVRRIAHQLRPIILDDLGLIPAIEWMIKSFNESTDISWRLINEIGDMEFNDEFTTAAFRVVQEMITNIIRHAKASVGTISFLKDQNEFFIKVSDNGVGFNTELKKRKGKLGLFGIEERIKPLNGKLQIMSENGSGTELLVTFPLIKIEKSND